MVFQGVRTAHLDHVSVKVATGHLRKAADLFHNLGWTKFGAERRKGLWGKSCLMIRIGTVSIELVEFSSKSFDCMAENHISIAVEDPFLVASEIERWAEEYIVDINLARDGRLGVVVRVNIPALLGSTLELVVLKQRIF